MYSPPLHCCTVSMEPALRMMFYRTLPLFVLVLKVRASTLTLIPIMVGLVFCILLIDEFYLVRAGV